MDHYFRDLRRYPLLSVDEERQIARNAQAGDSSAREQLVTANLRYVVSVAKKYLGMGLPLEDLVGEGNKGLIRAAETFDPARGVRFVSYAEKGIRFRMETALSHAPVVHRPRGSSTRDSRRVRRTAASLSQLLGGAPTVGEIAHALAMEEAAVAKALDDPYVVSDDHGFEAAIASPTDESGTPDADDLVFEIERRDAIVAVLGTLPKRHRTILRLRFGLDGPKLTLQQVGDILGVSRARIGQLEHEALARLRKRSRAIHLRPFHEAPGEAPATSRGRRAVPRLPRSKSPKRPRLLRGEGRSQGAAVRGTRVPPESSSAPAGLGASRQPSAAARALGAPRPEPGSLLTLRSFLVTRVCDTSIAAVADLAGVLARDLQDYLLGIHPPTTSFHKLRRWYEGVVPSSCRASEQEPARSRTSEELPQPERESEEVRRARRPGWGFVRGAAETSAPPPARSPRTAKRVRPNAPAAPRAVQDDIPVGTLRLFMQGEVERTSLRRAGEAAGIGKSGLAIFIAGTTRQPRARTLRALSDYYRMRQAETSDAAETFAPPPARSPRTTKCVRPNAPAVPPVQDDIPVGTLRSFMQGEVERTSLRRAGEAAGIGKSGLAIFIAGTTRQPRARTLRVLSDYYRMRQAETSDAAAS